MADEPYRPGAPPPRWLVPRMTRDIVRQGPELRRPVPAPAPVTYSSPSRNAVFRGGGTSCDARANRMSQHQVELRMQALGERFVGVTKCHGVVAAHAKYTIAHLTRNYEISFQRRAFAVLWLAWTQNLGLVWRDIEASPGAQHALISTWRLWSGRRRAADAPRLDGNGKWLSLIHI